MSPHQESCLSRSPSTLPRVSAGHRALLSAARLSLLHKALTLVHLGHRTPRCSPPSPAQPSSPTSRPPLHFRALPGVSAGPAPPDRNEKTSGSITTLGLKKFFLALGQGTRPKLGKSRSHSVEQLQPPAPGPAPHTSAPKVKRTPSLQSLHLVSPKGPANGAVRPVWCSHHCSGWWKENEVPRRPPRRSGWAGEAPVSPVDS